MKLRLNNQAQMFSGINEGTFLSAYEPKCWLKNGLWLRQQGHFFSLYGQDCVDICAPQFFDAVSNLSLSHQDLIFLIFILYIFLFFTN